MIHSKACFMQMMECRWKKHQFDFLEDRIELEHHHPRYIYNSFCPLVAIMASLSLSHTESSESQCEVLRIISYISSLLISYISYRTDCTVLVEAISQ